MKAALIALALLSLSVTEVGAVDLPTAGTTEGLSVSVNFLGGGTAALDQIEAAGCKFVRKDMSWGVVEWQTKGQYDFSDHDAFSQDCAARGIRILWCVEDHGHSLYGNDATDTAWQQGFANFAAAVADHYRGGSCLYEIMNEPENQTMLTGMPEADTYMSLLNKVTPAMRAADPNCRIIGPADSSRVNDPWMERCYTYNPGGGQKGLLDLVDAVSVHPYQWVNPEVVVDEYASLRTKITQYHPTGVVPVVSSEWGYSTVGNHYSVPNRQLQADYLARSFLVNMSQDIPLSNWYTFRDAVTGDPYEDAFGIVDNVREPKPAYYAMQTLANALQGKTFSTRLIEGISSDDWLLVFTSPGGQQTLAAWTTGDPHSITDPMWGTLNLSSTPSYVNPVPEPTPLMLLTIGGTSLLACAWRKEK